jgi:F0F1-type ATP synthase epsilon subunit
MFTSPQFWVSSLETAIRTAAAAALGVIGADQLITALDVDWATVGGVALLAAIVSVLTSVAVPNPDIRAIKAAARAQAAAEAEAEAEAQAKKAAAAAKRKAAKK